MNLTLKIWRQKNASDKGKMVDYKVTDISEHMSFLEMMDVLNEQIINNGEEPVAFDHDCREGICGMCSMYINGEAHGPDRGVTTCQLHMRMFKDGDTITIEPFRAAAFPVIKDLVVDRSSFERIQQSGGYISVNTSGNKNLDSYKTGELCLKSMDLASQILNKDGVFLSKFFMGTIFHEIKEKASKCFRKVINYKPLSSKKESKEIYIYCSGVLKSFDFHNL